MELAEAAQREALRDTRQPAPPPVIRSPGLPDLPVMYPPAPVRDTTFADLFTRLARCVRQAILLEARLDSGACDRPLTYPIPAARPAQNAAPHPPRPRTQGDGTGLEYERLEDDLAADAHRTPETILAEIAAELTAEQPTRLTPRPTHQPPHATPRMTGPLPPPESRPQPKPA